MRVKLKMVYNKDHHGEDRNNFTDQLNDLCWKNNNGVVIDPTTMDLCHVITMDSTSAIDAQLTIIECAKRNNIVFSSIIMQSVLSKEEAEQEDKEFLTRIKKQKQYKIDKLKEEKANYLTSVEHFEEELKDNFDLVDWYVKVKLLQLSNDFILENIDTITTASVKLGWRGLSEHFDQLNPSTRQDSNIIDIMIDRIIRYQSLTEETLLTLVKKGYSINLCDVCAHQRVSLEFIQSLLNQGINFDSVRYNLREIDKTKSYGLSMVSI